MTTTRPKPLRYTKTVSTYVPMSQYNEIASICSERNIALSTFVRELIDSYFDNQ